MNDTTALDSIRNTAARTKLARLGAAERACAARIAEETAVRKAIVDEMVAVAKKLKLSKVVASDWQLLKTVGRKTLKREKLLEQGVDPEVIENAMVKGKESWSVRARGKGDEENGDD